MGDLVTFLTHAAVTLVVTYGLTASVLFARPRVQLSMWLGPRRSLLVTGLYCPVCVGTWVAGALCPLYGGAHWVAQWFGVVALLILGAGAGVIPTAQQENALVMEALSE